MINISQVRCLFRSVILISGLVFMVGCTTSYLHRYDRFHQQHCRGEIVLSLEGSLSTYTDNEGGRYDREDYPFTVRVEYFRDSDTSFDEVFVRNLMLSSRDGKVVYKDPAPDGVGRPFNMLVENKRDHRHRATVIIGIKTNNDEWAYDDYLIEFDLHVLSGGDDEEVSKVKGIYHYYYNQKKESKIWNDLMSI